MYYISFITFLFYLCIIIIGSDLPLTYILESNLSGTALTARPRFRSRWTIVISIFNGRFYTNSVSCVINNTTTVLSWDYVLIATYYTRLSRFQSLIEIIVDFLLLNINSTTSNPIHQQSNSKYLASLIPEDTGIVDRHS